MTTITADFTIELTACDRRLTDNLQLVGYVIFGGVGWYTADGRSARDSAYEEVLCRVRDRNGHAHNLLFHCSYALSCHGHSGGIEDVDAVRITVAAFMSTTRLTPEETAAATTEMKEVLRGDSDSVMNKVTD